MKWHRGPVRIIHPNIECVPRLNSHDHRERPSRCLHLVVHLLPRCEMAMRDSFSFMQDDLHRLCFLSADVDRGEQNQQGEYAAHLWRDYCSFPHPRQEWRLKLSCTIVFLSEIEVTKFWHSFSTAQELCRPG